MPIGVAALLGSILENAKTSLLNICFNHSKHTAMGKLNFTRAMARTSLQSDFTFAKAKTSQAEKRADIQDHLACLLFLSL